MKQSYEFKKFCLVFLMSMLIFSWAGCTGSGNGAQNPNPTDNNFNEKGVAIHSAPSFARCVARHAVKRKGGE